MGITKKLECMECKKFWEIKVGAGRNHCNIKYILPNFTLEKQQKIKHELEMNPDATLDFQLKPAYCHTCREIISIPVLVINSKLYLSGRCKICDNEAELLHEKNIPCPHCNKVNLAERVTGMWD